MPAADLTASGRAERRAKLAAERAALHATTESVDELGDTEVRDIADPRDRHADREPRELEAEPPEPGPGVEPLEQELEGEEPAVPVPPPKPNGKPVAAAAPKPRPTQQRAAPERSQEIRDLDRRVDQDLKTWLGSLGSIGEIRIQVSRMQPQFHRGVKVNGLVSTHTQVIDEEQIGQMHGGGTYAIRVNRRDDHGRWVYWRNTTVEIAGDPRIDDVHRTAAADAAGGNGKPAGPASGDPIVTRAFDFMAQQAQQKASSAGGDFMAFLPLIEQMLKPLRDQNAALLSQLGEARKPPEQTASERAESKFVEKLLDGDSARIAAIEAQHRSEVAQLRQSMLDNEKRMEDRHDRAISDMTSRHDRELAAQKSGYERELSALRSSQELMTTTLRSSLDTSAKILENENKRLEKENDKLEKELAELRSKKDMSLTDKLKEVEGVKKLLGVGEEGEPKGKLETILASPVAERVADKLMGKLGGMLSDDEKPAEQPQHPLNRPFRAADGNVYMNTTQGLVLVPQQRLAQASRRRKAAQQAAAAQAPAAQPAQPGAEPQPGAEGVPPSAVDELIPEVADEPINLDPGDVKTAVVFMESAFQSGKDPGEFARSVRTLVPQSVLMVISRHGVDAFLDQVAELESTSALKQQSGRNWIRKVAKVLVGGGE